MKFKSVKKASELKLDGVDFQIELLDKQLNSVTLTDKSGNVVKFSKHGYSDFAAFVPQPPEMVKKFELRYTLALIGDKTELFDEKYEAESRGRELAGMYPEIRDNMVTKEVEVEQQD